MRHCSHPNFLGLRESAVAGVVNCFKLGLSMIIFLEHLQRGCLKNVPSTQIWDDGCSPPPVNRWSHNGPPKKPKRCRDCTPRQKWADECDFPKKAIIQLKWVWVRIEDLQPRKVCTCLQQGSNFLPVLRFLYLEPCHFRIANLNPLVHG